MVKTAAKVPAVVGAKVTSIWQESAGARAAEQVVVKVNCDAPPTLDPLSSFATESDPVVVLLVFVTVNRNEPTGVPTPVVPKSSVGGVMTSFKRPVPTTAVPVSWAVAIRVPLAWAAFTRACFTPAGPVGAKLTVKVHWPPDASGRPVQVSLVTVNSASVTAKVRMSVAVPPVLFTVKAMAFEAGMSATTHKTTPSNHAAGALLDLIARALPK